jgi:hypothetical protein
MPAVAAATAAEARAFFGFVRWWAMRETVTRNLLVGDGGVARKPGAYVGAETLGVRRRRATSSRETGWDRVCNARIY